MEDEPLIRQGLARAIRSPRLEITECGLGMDAIEEVKRSRYDLCFVDVNLPDISGIDVMKRIKEISPSTRVVVITSCLLDNEAEQDIETYSYSFIPKPFDIFQIRRVVKELFGENNI